MRMNLSALSRMGLVASMAIVWLGCACNGTPKTSACPPCSESQPRLVTAWLPLFFSAESLMQTKEGLQTTASFKAAVEKQQSALNAAEKNLNDKFKQLSKKQASMSPERFKKDAEKLNQELASLQQEAALLAEQMRKAEASAVQKITGLAADVIFAAEKSPSGLFGAVLHRESLAFISPAAKKLDITGAMIAAIDSRTDKTQANSPSVLSLPDASGLQWRVAFVNFETLVKGSKEGRFALKEAEKSENSSTEALRTEENNIRAANDALIKQQKSLSPDAYKKKVAELQNRYQQAQMNQATLPQKQAEAKAAILKPFNDKVRLILKQLQEDGHFDLVLKSTTMIYPLTHAADITTDVLRYLEHGGQAHASTAAKTTTTAPKLGGLSLAILDFQKLFEKSNPGIAIQAEFEQKKAKRAQDFANGQQALAAQQAKLEEKMKAGLLAPVEIARQRNQLQEEAAKLQKKIMDAEQRLKADYMRMVSDFQGDIDNVMASANLADLTFSTNAVAYEGGLPDITDKVVSLLNTTKKSPSAVRTSAEK